MALGLKDRSERATLLYNLRRSWGDEQGAIEAWDEPLKSAGMTTMPAQWAESGFDFHALDDHSECAPYQAKAGHWSASS